MADQLYFQGAEDVDRFFREGRPYFNDIYLEKMAQVSAYFNRVQTEDWKLNSTTEAKAFRFGRGWYDPCNPWTKVVSQRCESNSCDSKPEIIKRAGTDSYTYQLLRKEMQTEWICVEDLLYRLFPAEEIMHFEKVNATISRSVHEEFVRAQYVGASGNKWVGIADPDEDGSCELIDNQMFFVKEHEGDNEGSYNLTYVYVKLPTSDLANIAVLSLDMLDEALISLQDEDEAYRTDLTNATSLPLLDIIIPDPRLGRYLYKQAKNNNGFWDADTDFDTRLTNLKLGVNRIIGDYAFGYDVQAIKLNADDAYNATLGTFDASNPDTWPRLVRVPKYIQAPAELGCKYVPNIDYRNADFALSICWVPSGVVKHVQPSASGYGSAQMGARNYAGDWEWRRPDWESNPKMKSGFFQAEFRMAMQIKDPTVMNTFLHRMPKKKFLNAACCPLNANYVPPAAPDCYTCEGASQNG